MIRVPPRSNSRSFRRALAATCGFMAIVAAATPARAQCSPQELAKLTASDAASGDIFGSSVAVSSNTALVGAFYDDDACPGDPNCNSGSAYVFVRCGGEWAQQAKLSASDAALHDNFGVSVALSGDTALVGAYRKSGAGGVVAGAAYVFLRSSGVWAQQAKLIAPDTTTADYFGFSVAVSGDTAVVGAYNDDHPGAPDAGSAYIFVRSETIWTLQAKLIASDRAVFDNFGYSVAISASTAVVGACRDDHTGGNDAGSAYVFVEPPGGWTNMTETAKLTASDASEGDFFGVSLAISGDSVVAGASYDDPTDLNSAGSAYTFVRSGTVWTQQAKLIASDAAANVGFGNSVAVSGNTVLVGAIAETHGGVTHAGAAYEFVRSGILWTERAKLTASDAAASDGFGNSVAVSDDTAVVGAYFDNHARGSGTINGQGSAYIFPSGADTDCDGVLDTTDSCPNNPPNLPIDCTGRPLRDADNDCLVNPADIPLIVDELLSLTIPPTGCNGLPLRDTNNDATVNAADLQQIVNELLNP